MATILVFRPSAVVRASKSDAPRQGSAEIVIFPGIRYERWSDDRRASAVAQESVERDMLKLVD